jgi:hypothetical protein
MPFKKGTSGNINGRPKGSVNKNKALITNFIDIEIDKNFIKFNDELNKLNGKDFISVFLKLAKIMKHENTGLKANEKLIELFNQKIIANGQ